VSRLVTIIAVLFAGLANSVAGSFTYVAPQPGSRGVRRRPTIILRASQVLSPAVTDTVDIIVAEGERSGKHEGTLQLSDDDHTLVFTPATDFQPGEDVVVSYPGGMRTASGGRLEPVSFSFTITTTGGAILDRLAALSDASETRSMPKLRTAPDGPTTTTSDSLPASFPAIAVTASDNPTTGGIFLSSIVFDTSIHITNYLMVLNNDGAPYAYHALNTTPHDFTRQPDGSLTYFVTNARRFVGADSTFATTTTYASGNGYVTDPHELRLLPNGHLLLIGLDYQRVRMDTLVEGGDTSAIVIGNTIQELDGAHNVVFEWRSWDHFALTDATHEDLTAGVIDYVHMNAIDVDTDGNLLLSSRHLDEITKIDRTTGAIMWRLGGKHNMFTFINDSIGFSHQHAIRRIANGHLTLFDNGNFHQPSFSRAIEYAIDTASMQATLVWQYRNMPDIYGMAMGYVQRLENGNTLIGWGAANPSVTEVRPDGSKALELSLPAGVFSYRAFRFPWGSTPLPVSGGDASAATFVLDQNYPNPWNPSTTIRYSVPKSSHVTLFLYNVLGQQVACVVDENENAGSHKAVVQGIGLTSGVYFYRLQAGDFTATKKLILLR
jgi:hypothetical protein